LNQKQLKISKFYLQISRDFQNSSDLSKAQDISINWVHLKYHTSKITSESNARSLTLEAEYKNEINLKGGFINNRWQHWSQRRPVPKLVIDGPIPVIEITITVVQ